MERDAGEVFIMCRDCNGYIAAQEGESDILIGCPFQCEPRGDGFIFMKIPEGAPKGRW